MDDLMLPGALLPPRALLLPGRGGDITPNRGQLSHSSINRLRAEVVGDAIGVGDGRARGEIQSCPGCSLCRLLAMASLGRFLRT